MIPPWAKGLAEAGGWQREFADKLFAMAV